MKKIRHTTTKMLAFVMTLALLTLAACSNSAAPSSIASSSPSSTIASSSSTTSSEASHPVSSQSEVSQQQSTTTGGTIIAVTPVTVQGESNPFYITDGNTQGRILDYLSGIQSIEPVLNPITGGYFFNLSISHEGSTAVYELSNHDNTPNGHFRIYKDNQPYSVDPALWDVIAESYPSFARSQESAPHTNPFSLDPVGGYDLYAYNGPLLSYAKINESWLQPGDFGPEFKAAVAAINNLPALEKATAVPSQNAQYGLMSVAQDYSKVQFFLYEDFLTVNGTAYAITNEQYETLKAAMSAGIAPNNGIATPQWFVYMNPNRVTKIQCKDEQGKMTEIRKENILLSAVTLGYISVNSVKTYTPGSKNLNNSPFIAVYTFDSGATYTVYVSDDTPRTGGVTFYVESSDMNYACEYVSETYISDYTEYTRDAIDGPVNPWTM